MSTFERVETVVDVLALERKSVIAFNPIPPEPAYCLAIRYLGISH
jgi:hypothetical protein